MREFWLKVQNAQLTWYEFNGVIFGECPFLKATLNLHLTFDHFARLQRRNEEITKMKRIPSQRINQLCVCVH